MITPGQRLVLLRGRRGAQLPWDGDAAALSLRPVGVASVQGTLARDLTPRQDPPYVSPQHRLLRRGRRGHGSRRPTGVRRFSGRIVEAVVEIVGGDRPVSQVLRWTTPPVYQDLGRRAAWRPRPSVAALDRAASRAPDRRVVYTCFVSADVAGSRHVRYGHRSRAVAARFERQRESWWACAALEFA